MTVNKIAPPLLNAVRLCAVEKINVVVYFTDIAASRKLRTKNIVREFPFLRAVGLSCYPYELEGLARLPYVEYISSDNKVFTLDFVGEDLLKKYPRTRLEHQPRADVYIGVSDDGYISAEAYEAVTLLQGNRLTGKEVTLCVMDTGIQPHTDLSVPVNRIDDFHDVINEGAYPYDDNGHGTFVSGVAAGSGFASGRRITGVAPDARLVGVKVIKQDGESGAFDVLDGMQWVLDNRKRLNIKVVCMSFGSTPIEANDPLKRGAEVLVKNGITVVCASGNSGENALKSPGISPDVITVGAVNIKDYSVAEFSSRGSFDGRRKPEIYASGVNVTGISTDSAYTKMSGTSVSAPYVAGACCLLHQRFKNLTPQRVKELLMLSSRRVQGNLILDLGL